MRNGYANFHNGRLSIPTAMQTYISVSLDPTVVQISNSLTCSDRYARSKLTLKLACKISSTNWSKLKQSSSILRKNGVMSTPMTVTVSMSKYDACFGKSSAINCQLLTYEAIIHLITIWRLGAFLLQHMVRNCVTKASDTIYLLRRLTLHKATAVDVLNPRHGE